MVPPPLTAYRNTGVLRPSFYGNVVAPVDLCGNAEGAEQFSNGLAEQPYIQIAGFTMIYLESSSTDPAFNLALEQFVFELAGRTGTRRWCDKADDYIYRSRKIYCIAAFSA